MPTTLHQQQKERVCYFCQHGLNHVDYKDVQLLRRFTTSHAKIVSRRRSGVCLKHQHKLALAIKRARVMALLQFVSK